MNKKIAVLLLSTAFSASAVAAEEGFYLGANLGQSSTDKLALSTKTGTSFSLIGGYQFMKYVAAEIEWNDMGSPTLALTNPAGGGSSAKIDGYSAKAVGIYPFNDMWSIFGKLGYAHMKMGVVGTSKNDITYGIGGQYNFTTNWGVNLNYDMYSVDGPVAGGTVGMTQKATTSVASVGVQYKF